MYIFLVIFALCFKKMFKIVRHAVLSHVLQNLQQQQNGGKTKMSPKQNEKHLNSRQKQP